MYKYYTFCQNNSGGDLIGPPYVIVRATSACEANDKAETHAGVYFDGCYNDQDCPCCGDRWSLTREYEAARIPQINTDVIKIQCLNTKQTLTYKGTEVSYVP